jgi:hypothetical protein
VQRLPALQSVVEFRETGAKWAVAETEVSPSNFISGGENVICWHRVPLAARSEI